MMSKRIPLIALLLAGGMLAAQAPAAGFQDALSWWRFDDLADKNGPPNSNLTFFDNGNDGTVTWNNAEAIPGVDSNDRYGHIGQAGENFSHSDGRGAGSEWFNAFNADPTEMTVFARVRFPEAITSGTVRIFHKRYPPSQKSFSLQYDPGTPRVHFEWSYNGSGTGADLNIPGTLDAGKWYDLTGVMTPDDTGDPANTGHSEFYLYDTAAAALLASVSSSGSSRTSVHWPNSAGERVRIASNSFVGDFESMAIWNMALSAAEVEALTVPEPATLCVLAIGAVGLVRRRRI